MPRATKKTVIQKSRSTKKSKGKAPDRWDLTHLMKNTGDECEALFKNLDSKVSHFEALRESLSPDMSATTFQTIQKLNEEITRLSSRIGAYAYLWFSENTQNLKARAFKSKVEERLTTLHNRLLFFDLWWQSIDEHHAARLLEGAGDLRYYLESIRRFKPHTLSEPEEKIINTKNTTGRSMINTLYDVLTNRLTFTLKLKGKRKTFTREELSAYVRNPNARIRTAAYKELYRVFGNHHDLIGEMYIGLVNDWKSENLEMRNYLAPIETRNLGNDVPNQSIQALLNVCAKNTELFQEYFSLKGRICKISSMNRYHLYAPHPSDCTKYSYQDAVRMVLEAYRGFSPTLADHAEQIFRDHHIDARSHQGKMSGAYCYSVTPTGTPYVFLNYTGEARDIATLAHELGHAVHGMMAKDHSIFTFHSTLPLAETASVFGERILSDSMMAQEKNTRVKQGLLLAQLDDLYATILRQAFFVRFEEDAHTMVGKGATVEDLAAMYLRNLRQQFGKAVPVPDEFKWEWLSIPHIFASPFYCYAYSFGNLLVLSLYQRYKEEGQAFVPKYLDLLAAGGSQSPTSLLQPLGVDICSEKFWQSGFNTIADMVEELQSTI